eukprot:TRINITY_DN11319_c0_g1_i1.p1 TRINITY_DN11319_c0_g1~~TRINITY_DN11319_c0_g1_i1.p1  ORF type:complete len:513 (-),score=80.89 TRINITY_DN11319_c0_g1_i1:56-1594(-)
MDHPNNSRSEFEEMHFKFGAQWLILLEKISYAEQEKEVFREKLKAEQQRIDTEQPEQSTSSLVSPRSKVNRELWHGDPRMGQTMEFSSSSLAHSINKFKQIFGDKEREYKSTIENAKLLMHYYFCSRYILDDSDNTDSLGPGNRSVEIEKLLDKFGKEVGMGIEEVHEKANSELTDLLRLLKRTGENYKSLIVNSNKLRVEYDSLMVQWNIFTSQNDKQQSESNLDFSILRVALYEKVRELNELLCLTNKIFEEIRDNSKKITSISSNISRKLRFDRTTSLIEIGSLSRSATPEPGYQSKRHRLTSSFSGPVPNTDVLLRFPRISGNGRNNGNNMAGKQQFFIPEGADSRVYFWLQQQGLLDFFDYFLKEGMKYENIIKLKDEDLVKMGIANLAARRNLLAMVKTAMAPGYKVMKKGWMMKKGEVRKSWKERFFILLDCGLLWYYTSESNGKAKGHIDMGSCVKVGPANLKGAPKGYPFAVVTFRRTYVLCCVHETEMVGWCSTLEKFIRRK